MTASIHKPLLSSSLSNYPLPHTSPPVAQVAVLPSSEQLLLGGFLLRLSRTARPAHRLMAVEAAHALLTGLPQPFAPEAGWQVRGALMALDLATLMSVPCSKMPLGKSRLAYL